MCERKMRSGEDNRNVLNHPAVCMWRALYSASTFILFVFITKSDGVSSETAIRPWRKLHENFYHVLSRFCIYLFFIGASFFLSLQALMMLIINEAKTKTPATWLKLTLRSLLWSSANFRLRHRRAALIAHSKIKRNNILKCAAWVTMMGDN